MLVLLRWSAKLHHNRSLTTPPEKERGEKIQWKGLEGWDKDRKIIVMGETEAAQGEICNLLPIVSKLEEWETKNKKKKV